MDDILMPRPPKKNVPTILIVLAVCSFIPILGLLFGLISIIIALTDFRRYLLLFILGLSGIMFYVIMFGAVYYFGFVQRGGYFDQIRAQQSRTMMHKIVRELKTYKATNGSYPDDLDEISNRNGIMIVDPVTMVIATKGFQKYYYKAENDTFTLFSVGIDGTPFTKDDIYPGDSTTFEKILNKNKHR